MLFRSSPPRRLPALMALRGWPSPVRFISPSDRPRSSYKTRMNSPTTGTARANAALAAAEILPRLHASADQRVISVHLDCDGDTVLLRVEQTGAACHTGNPTCSACGCRRTAHADLYEYGSVSERRDLPHLYRPHEWPRGSGHTERRVVEQSLPPASCLRSGDERVPSQDGL